MSLIPLTNYLRQLHPLTEVQTQQFSDEAANHWITVTIQALETEGERHQVFIEQIQKMSKNPGKIKIFSRDEYNAKINWSKVINPYRVERDRLEKELAIVKGKKEPTQNIEDQLKTNAQNMQAIQQTFSIICTRYTNAEGKNRYLFMLVTDIVSGEQGGFGIVFLGFPIVTNRDNSCSILFDTPVAIKKMAVLPDPPEKDTKTAEEKHEKDIWEIIKKWKISNPQLGSWPYYSAVVLSKSVPVSEIQQDLETAGIGRSRASTITSAISAEANQKTIIESYMVLPWRDGKSLAAIIEEDVFLDKNRELPEDQRKQRDLPQRMSYLCVIDLSIAVIKAIKEFQQSSSFSASSSPIVPGAAAAAGAQSVPLRVHGDIKPANIMCCYTNNAWSVKLVDYTTVEDNTKIIKEKLAGTLCYTHPQRIRAQQDKRSQYVPNPIHDVYSLGIVLAIILSGSYKIIMKRSRQFEDAQRSRSATSQASQQSIVSLIGPLAPLDVAWLHPDDPFLRSRYPLCNLKPICDIIRFMVADYGTGVDASPSFEELLKVFQNVRDELAQPGIREDFFKLIIAQAQQHDLRLRAPAILKAQISKALIEAVMAVHREGYVHEGLDPLKIQYCYNPPGSGRALITIILPDHNSNRQGALSSNIEVALHDLDPDIFKQIQDSLADPIASQPSYQCKVMHDIYNVGLLLLLVWLDSDIAVLNRAEQLKTSHALSSQEKKLEYKKRALKEKMDFIKFMPHALVPLNLKWMQEPKATRFWQNRYPNLNAGAAAMVRATILLMLRIDENGQHSTEQTTTLESAHRCFEMILTDIPEIIVRPAIPRKFTPVPLWGRQVKLTLSSPSGATS